MKIMIAVIAVVAVLGLALFFQSPKSDEAATNTTASSQTSEEVTFANVQTAVAAEEAAFIDVRTPEEYYDSHIEGAELLPLQVIELGTLPDHTTDNTLYVYCRSGNRSAEAATILERAGYEVVDLGGLQDVVAIGGNITTDTCPLGDKVACLN
jgi:phage shock protein E